MLYEQVRLGVKSTLPLMGNLQSADQQDGASYLQFLKETPSETVAAAPVPRSGGDAVELTFLPRDRRPRSGSRSGFRLAPPPESAVFQAEDSHRYSPLRERNEKGGTPLGRTG